jgi:hypothetical protein
LGKTHFNHDIDERLEEEFQRVAQNLPGAKYQKVEAAIRLFNALPDELQLRLLSASPENRGVVLAAIAALQTPQKARKSSRRA